MTGPLLRPVLERLQDRISGHIARDPDALIVLMRLLDDAEASGEAAVFERVEGRVGGRMAALVRRHADDERRHLAMTRAALVALGDDGSLADTRANLVEHVEAELDRILDPALDADDADLGRAYLLLFALERRMCAQLRQLGAALAPERPELAAVLHAILADELRHVRWCEAIAFELLGHDHAAFEVHRDAMLALEARVYARVTAQNLSTLLDVAFREVPRWERALLRGVAAVLRVVPGVPVPDRDGALGARAWSRTLASAA